jgi:hypothetical protein
MERPGFEPPLCAQSTNRSLYATYSQTLLDKCASLHRRMTISQTYSAPRFISQVWVELSIGTWGFWRR